MIIEFMEVDGNIVMSAPQFRLVMTVIDGLIHYHDRHGLCSVSTCKICINEYDSNSDTCGESLILALENLIKHNETTEETK